MTERSSSLRATVRYSIGKVAVGLNEFPGRLPAVIAEAAVLQINDQERNH